MKSAERNKMATACHCWIDAYFLIAYTFKFDFHDGEDLRESEMGPWSVQFWWSAACRLCH